MGGARGGGERERWGKRDGGRNVLLVSVSPAALALSHSHLFTAAEREITFIFPNTTIKPFPSRQAAENYLSKYVNPTLLKAHTQLCKLKLTNPVIWLADWLFANNPNRPAVQEGIVELPSECGF